MTCTCAMRRGQDQDGKHWTGITRDHACPIHGDPLGAIPAPTPGGNGRPLPPRRRGASRLRKARSAAQEALLAYKKSAPVGIGPTRAEAKDAALEAEAAIIGQVRDYIFRVHRSCQLCHGKRWSECLGLDDQMHEHPPRSATRGLRPEERFNLLTCIRVCVRCHADLTEHRLALRFSDPTRGFLGQFWAEPAKSE